MKTSKHFYWLFLMVAAIGCQPKIQSIKPTVQDITESVYASGVIKSANQYEVFASVNGIIEQIAVNEGDSIYKGQSIFYISNQTNKLNRQNAQINASYNQIGTNQDKLNEAQLAITFAKNKYELDSSLYYRQKTLWQQNIGSQVDVEQAQLGFENSKTNYQLAITKYNALKKQLSFADQQSKKNLEIYTQLENDFIVKSKIDGLVYKIWKKKGELVNQQTPLGIIGSANEYVLELQVDEYDIVKIKVNQKVAVQLDSYKGSAFEAVVTKINPIMNERTKSFLVEAVFTKKPQVLYPNLTAEANIIIQTKSNALTLPRLAVMHNYVVKVNGDTTYIKTGLKDYERIEIIDGLKPTDEVLNLNL